MFARLRPIACQFDHFCPTFASRVPLEHREAMSSFILPRTTPQVSVHLTEDLGRDQLLSFPAFQNWLSTLQHSLSLQKNKDHTFNSAPYKLRKIDIQSVDFFGGGRVGFVKLKAEVSNDHGEKLPGSVFLRGGSVAMMVRVFQSLARLSTLQMLTSGYFRVVDPST